MAFEYDISKSPWNEEDSAQLASLLAMCARKDPQKGEFMEAARCDFDWKPERLIDPYVDRKWLPAKYYRGLLANGQEGLASADWLNGLLTSGDTLSAEHVQILVTFVNPCTSIPDIQKGTYCSGEDFWKTQRLRLNLLHLLIVLDSAALANAPVSIPTYK